jgi:septal ring factor EnvC (AmiA/AmiB activator)
MAKRHILANLPDGEKERLRGVARQITEFRKRCELLEHELEMQESAHREIAAQGTVLNDRLETVRGHIREIEQQSESDGKRIQELTESCERLSEERSALLTRARVQAIDSESLQYSIQITRMNHNRPTRTVATQVRVEDPSVGVNTEVTAFYLSEALVQAPDDGGREMPAGKRPSGLTPISTVQLPAVPEYGVLTKVDDDLTDLISGLNE